MRLIIIIGLVVLLGGCVVGGLIFFKPQKEPEIFQFPADEYDNPTVAKKGKNKEGPNTEKTDLDREKEDEDRKEAAQRREETLKLFLEFPYFRLPLIAVPIVRSGRVCAYLHLRIAMKATGRETFTRSKVLLPRLVDGIYGDLYKSFENLWDQSVDPKTSVIKERIFAVCEKVLGRNHIETVYLREMHFNRTKIE